MNVYTERTNCSICGGPAVCKSGEAYLGGVHRNPEVCRQYLEEEANRLEQLREELENQPKPIGTCKCGASIYIEDGFCGVCEPHKL